MERNGEVRLIDCEKGSGRTIPWHEEFRTKAMWNQHHFKAVILAQFINISFDAHKECEKHPDFQRYSSGYE
jgi:hypothetical protein